MRKIIHIDCDCFYASVEMRDNPALRGVPLAVGGSAEGRGVLATCNYEARQFGLHSAMPTAIALRQCPDLVLVRPRFDVYKAVSRQVHEIFKRYTSLIEPLSLDEAYLDVSECEAFQGSATWIAENIRHSIEQEVGITASAGIAPNKFLAKIASDWQKPNGQFVIRPEDVDAFVAELPVRKIPGVGKATMVKMQKLGIETCQDLAQQEPHILSRHFGVFGERLASLARGVDHRPVKTSRIRKSLGVERTFSKDVASLAEAKSRLPDLLEEFFRRFRRIREHYRIKSIGIKIKTADFQLLTIEKQASECSLAACEALLDDLWQRKNQPIRLLGLSAGLLPVDADQAWQLPLFDGDESEIEIV